MATKTKLGEGRGLEGAGRPQRDVRPGAPGRAASAHGSGLHQARSKSDSLLPDYPYDAAAGIPLSNGAGPVIGAGQRPKSNVAVHRETVGPTEESTTGCGISFEGFKHGKDD